MKIGMYTDIHCAYTSSILPIHCEGTKYTTRLKMIIDTFKWMYSVFSAQNVEIIVNCGDLFDSHNLRSEEISAMSEALSYSRGVPEYHVLGNHEILDKRRNFYASAMLSNYAHITIVDVPLKLKNGLSFLPYMEVREVNECLSLISNKVLFSHIDIQGSRLNQFHVLEEGVQVSSLSDIFGYVFNGHIHTYQNLGKGVYNIGATTSYSFADDMQYDPSICIFDTDTGELTRIRNPYAIKFIKAECSAESQLAAIKSFLNSMLDRQLVLRISCESQFKYQLSELLDAYDNVVTYRIQSSSIDNSELDSEFEKSNSVNTARDVVDKFRNFINTDAELKYSREYYHKVIDTYLRGDAS